MIMSRTIRIILGKGYFFPTNAYGNHWIVIVVNEIVKQVMVFNLMA